MFSLPLLSVAKSWMTTPAPVPSLDEEQAR